MQHFWHEKRLESTQIHEVKCKDLQAFRVAAQKSSNVFSQVNILLVSCVMRHVAKKYIPSNVRCWMAWQQLTIESIDSLYGSGDRINYCHKARQRRWTMQPLLACPGGGGEEKLSRFPQTPHHKPRRDCLLLQRCTVLGMLQIFALFIFILIDKIRWDGLYLGLILKAADRPTLCSSLETLLTKKLLCWNCIKTKLGY